MDDSFINILNYMRYESFMNFIKDHDLLIYIQAGGGTRFIHCV